MCIRDTDFGIGGYDRVMGPNGQAQYGAPNLRAACRTLFAHYEHTYIAPGEHAALRLGAQYCACPFGPMTRSYPPIPKLSSADTPPCLLYTSPSPRDRQKSRM